MSIGTKMIEVMRACRYMVKDAENAAQGYKYLSAAGMFAQINAELTARNLYTQATMTLIDVRQVVTVNNTQEKFAVVEATVIITDAATGETVTFGGTGSGQDAGDKAVMKANTAALKYAYIGGLCIAMSDDPESDTNTAAYPRKPNPAGMNNVVGKCDKCGKAITQKVVDYSRQKFGQRLCIDCQKLMLETVPN